ncbi:MAG: CAP domain-containing protein [Anaerolineales bacterium]|nr:CAP domain-containing protein [Anaerolineales bacterium]
MRTILMVSVLICLSLLLTLIGQVAIRPAMAQSAPNPYDLIAAVNALRTSNGLPAYTINSILMQIAQAQANYQATIGQVTHIGPGGTRPYQRALAAGYPLAGDLSRGGFIAENVFYGTSIQEAVNWWYNSPSHYNTMMSSNFLEIGAGIAAGTGGWYFTIVAARPTASGTPQPYTPLPGGWSPPTPTLATNTPNPDGAIVHVVQAGDTLGALSLAYDVPLKDILAFNRLTLNSVIYPGQKIIIRPAFTTTPTQPTATPTRRPSSTPWPTSTSLRATATPFLSPTFSSVPLKPSASAGGAVLGIVVVSLLAAGIITWLGAKKS